MLRRYSVTGNPQNHKQPTKSKATDRSKGDHLGRRPLRRTAARARARHAGL